MSFGRRRICRGYVELIMTRPRITGAIVAVTNISPDLYYGMGVHYGTMGGKTLQGREGLEFCIDHGEKPRSITVSKGMVKGILRARGSMNNPTGTQ